MNDSNASLNSGHRKRMKEKFLRSNHESMHDYELLEVLLFYAKPRADVRPLAKQLIKEFGSLNKLFSVDIEKLNLLNGVGDSISTLIKICKEISIRLAKEDLTAKPIIESWNSLIEYVRITMGSSSVEQVRVIYLDKKYMVISDEYQTKGTVDHTPVYPREIIKRAIFLDASSFVMVHNHPSGNTKPSKSDIVVTEQLNELSKSLSIKMLDHIIIGAKDYYSFKNSGILI